jgi:hypothetical protein
MRSPAFFARHPRLRTWALCLAVAVALVGGARLWMSVPPDAVHITIDHLLLDEEVRYVVADRTIHDGAVARRLQRDFTALPLQGLLDAAACPSSRFGGRIYDTYTLTWYRAGLPVEQAHVDDTGCAIWRDDGVFFRRSYGAQTLYADIEAALWPRA